MTWRDLEKDFKKLGDPERAKHCQRYFKTGKGEYGEGDIFLGLKTAIVFEGAKKYHNLSLADLEQLLKSKFHEIRAAALVILKRQYTKADTEGKAKIAKFYLKNTIGINNWDLVDISAPYILGDWLLDKDRAILYKLAKSKNLWQRRIAIMATAAFIRAGEYQETLKIAQILLADRKDLIHKAVGWMLREIGKRDQILEEKFLQKNIRLIPRTALRYAIEKFPSNVRQKYLKM
jgi:3-methyladenine DNA glycosylase AlkD